MKKQLLTIAILASSPLLFAHASRPATPVPQGLTPDPAQALEKKVSSRFHTAP